MIQYPKEIFWKTKRENLRLTPFPRWVGILNVTPDSFSDGGLLAKNISGKESFKVDVVAAFQKGLSLIAEGADIIDIGGESTRPGSLPVPPKEQKSRVIPVIEQLAQTGIPISIDTTNAETAEAALSAGASIVNDISGTLFDPDIKEIVRRHHAGICIGHIRGIPRTMQDAPVYTNPTEEIASFLRSKRNDLINFGISPEQIVIDPGIGFGKTLSHNLAILSHLAIFTEIGSPILIGHSRKRFLTEIDTKQSASPYLPPGTDAERLDFLTAALTKRLIREGVALFRVHRVSYNRSAAEDPNFPEMQL